MPTSISAYSKPDTRLILDGVTADPFIDYSQYRTDLADQTTYVDESPSARAAIAGSREILIQWDINDVDTGILLELGNAGSYSYRVEVASGGVVVCSENGSEVVRGTIGSIDPADGKITIHWSIHPDGASTRSELLLYNHPQTHAVVAQATHTTGTVSATDTLTVGAGFGGASAFSGGLDFYIVRIGARFHSLTEATEDWIAATTPPAVTQTRRHGPLMPDRASLVDIASDGAFVGPALLWAGHCFEQADRRLVGAILNHRVPDPVAITYAYANDVTAWWSSPPGDSDLNSCVALLFRRPVPRKVNRAYVRAFLRMNNGSAATVAEARLRVYSISGLPVAGQGDAPLVYHRTAQVTRQTDDGTAFGAGAWVAPGALDLAVDDLGYTWILVAVSFDEGHAEIANTELYVHALTLDPYHDPSDSGGFGFSEP